MKRLLSVASLALLAVACQEDDAPKQPNEDQDLDLISSQVNFETTDIAPLSPVVTFTTAEPVSVEAKVLGKNGPESDLAHTFDSLSTDHSLTVLGLYPDYNNTIALRLFDDEGRVVDFDTLEFQTTSNLPTNLPGIEIEAVQKDKMAEGLTLVSNYGVGAHVPFIIDHFGDIRWYLDFATDQELGNLFYDCGIERLQNGNLYFGDKNSRKIYEVNMRGEKINTWDLGSYSFHHNVQEKPDGNLLVTVDKDGSTHDNGRATIEDYVIEIDRQSGSVVMEWDLKESLDEYRTTMINNLEEDPVDWFHGNAVIYDETDNTIIVSGRTQGLVKLDYNNKVKWILSPHKGWSLAGNGEDLNQYLLDPLDASGNPITDQAVLDGDTSHADFEWNWYQHAPLYMPDGSLMLFDNGHHREWDQAAAYSRAVEFDIDEENMTVQQKWSYGKERGHDTYSFIVSDVDYIPAADNVLFSPGCMVINTPSGKNEGRVVEIDYTTKEVVFEARFIAPDGAYVVLHRAERMSLYP